MYERTVTVPRLYGVLNVSCEHPAVERMRRALSSRYDVEFNRVSLGYYRHGRDSVAWHGDTLARELDEALVATVSVGAPRKFSIKSSSGGASRSLMLGWGDLLVMGGTCQRTYRHAVPKVASAAPRIAIMFRPTWEQHD